MTRRWIWGIICVVFVSTIIVTAGCGDDVRTTKSVTRHEQEPARMVSPGQEVVE